jgi:hypothetical protein
MAGQTTIGADAILKDVYERGICELIPTKTVALSIFEDGDNSAWSGREVVFPSRVGRNQGVGSATEGGNLPTAGSQKYAQTRIPCRYLYGRITFTAQAMAVSESSRGAFAPVMRQEMDGLIKDLQNERGRQIYGDGRGILALVNGASAGTTVTVDAPGNFAGATNGARFINPGEIVAFVNPATGALRASSVRTVQAIASDGTTFTIDAALSVTDNDYIVRAQTTSITDVSDTSYGKEVMGLAGSVDDGTNVPTYHNVSRTAYPIAASTVITGVGAWSQEIVMRGLDVADQRGGGQASDLFVHHSLRRAYISSTDPDRRYMAGDLMRPDEGTAAAKQATLTFGGIPMHTDKYCPYNTMFGIDRQGCTRYTLKAGEWANEDGAILCRIGTGSTATDAFEAFYRIWDNFHFDYCNRSFRLDGFTGTTIIVAHVD